VTGRFGLIPVLYSLIVITWVSGFDIIYSLQDDEFDRSNRLYSIPSEAGRKKAIIISIIVHLLTFIMIIATGFAGKGGIFFWTGAAVFTALLIYQHQLVKHDDLSRVNLAFATTNGIASLLFAAFIIIDLLA
jgi:4-hydroxybenzoate polyprenyltransferase